MLRPRSALGTALGISLVALNLAACSSSGSTKASTAGTASIAGTGSSSTQATTSTTSTVSPAASAASAAAAAPASGQGEPLAPIGCGGITPAMVNDLVTTPVTSITFSSGLGVYPDHHFECDAGMEVDVFPLDSNKSDYTTDLAAENVPPNPMPGVGDVAVYTLAPFAGMPDVYAHKGTVTCELKPSSTVSEYKITVDPSSSFAGIATKDAQAAWATKAAGLCTAIFTALKA